MTPARCEETFALRGGFVSNAIHDTLPEAPPRNVTVVLGAAEECNSHS